MHRLTSALALLAFCTFLPAQAGKDQGRAATAEYDKLVAEWKAESKASREAMQKVQATPEYKAAREAKDNQKATELMSAVKRPDAKAYGERALKLADQFGDDGIKFVAYAASNFNDKVVAQGIAERISTKYLSSAGLVDVLENGRGVMAGIGKEAANELLSKIAKESKVEQAKAWALYQQGNLLRSQKPSDEDKAKMAELHAAAAKLATGDLADRLAAPKFQEEHLQIGMEVPNIIGEDVDGVPFKLSDYRGKVVVIDFWGFW